MKKILTLLIILTISSQSFACTCMGQSIIDRYAKSDFVATISVISVDSETETDFINLEIKIIELYKGTETNLLKIRKSRGIGCSTYAPENTKWLIFATIDEKANLSYGYCSGPEQLDRTFNNEKYPNAQFNYNQGLERKIELLTSLKNEKIEPINIFDLYAYFRLEGLNKFKGYKVENDYNAFYEITVRRDLNLKSVKAIKEFDNERLSKELLEFIKENILIGRKGNLDEIPEETKIILGLYYYPAEKDRESIIVNYSY